ncbi:hypothetical protein GCM10007904_28620 [Oharaeibacter diazotrophicus]|nr:hypothetical protein GCM10007904_28620 [Oharaeibacter diazotrophicus]
MLIGRNGAARPPEDPRVDSGATGFRRVSIVPRIGGYRGRFNSAGDRLAAFGTSAEGEREGLDPRTEQARRLDYNDDRPHTSPSGLAPDEFATRSGKDRNQNGFWL